MAPTSCRRARDNTTTSSSAHGGGLHITDASARILPSTISGNSSAGDGGGIYISGADQAEPTTSSSPITTTGLPAKK